MCVQTTPRFYSLWCYLVIVAHEGPLGVLGPQEAVDQHGPAKREVEADVLLKVAAELVTGQVITEAEALTRNQLIYLLSDRVGQQRLQTLCSHTQVNIFSHNLAQMLVTQCDLIHYMFPHNAHSTVKAICAV